MQAQPLSIIVAGEDHAMRQQLVGMIKGELGALVREVPDGWGIMSLLLLCGDSFDLVISDLHVLRGGRRLETLVSLRAAGVDVPFLLIGDCGNPTVHSTAARLSALVLDEPVVGRELMAGVRQLCGLQGPSCDREDSIS